MNFGGGSKVDWPSVIRNFRMSKRLKQAALAADLGVTQAMVSRWENGESEPPERVKRRMAELVHDAFVVAPAPTWTDLVALNPTITFVSDAEHCLRIVSRGMLDLLGRRRGEIEGRMMSQIFGGDFMEGMASLKEQGFFNSAVAHAQSLGSLVYQHADGERTVAVDCIHAPRIDRGEGVVCVSSMAVLEEGAYLSRLEERGQKLFVRKTF